MRDVACGEDAWRVRSGAAPQVLASLRNALISLLNRLGYVNKAAALRFFAAHTLGAYLLVRDPPKN